MLMLSGIQHFAFCQRQWALIHLEQQWDENHLTIQGNWMHERVDKPHYHTRRHDCITLRALPLSSASLGLYGRADVVEMHAAEGSSNATTHPKYEGWWHLMPVEYKRGKPKRSPIDELQLCAQAICLEEMHHIHIPYAALYYGETRHRDEVELSESLRSLTEQTAYNMHEIYRSRQTPIARYEKKCNSCSLYEVCQPRITHASRRSSDYLQQLYEDN